MVRALSIARPPDHAIGMIPFFSCIQSRRSLKRMRKEFTGFSVLRGIKYPVLHSSLAQRIAINPAILQSVKLLFQWCNSFDVSNLTPFQ